MQAHIASFVKCEWLCCNRQTAVNREANKLAFEDKQRLVITCEPLYLSLPGAPGFYWAEVHLGLASTILVLAVALIRGRLRLTKRASANTNVLRILYSARASKPLYFHLIPMSATLPLLRKPITRQAVLEDDDNILVQLELHCQKLKFWRDLEGDRDRGCGFVFKYSRIVRYYCPVECEHC
jgi:hypothetical protein